MEYQPLETIYPDDEEKLRGPIGTQIVVYQNKKFMKTDVVFGNQKKKCQKTTKENNRKQ